MSAQRISFGDSARASYYSYGRFRHDFCYGTIRIERLVLDGHARLLPDRFDRFLAVKLDEAALRFHGLRRLCDCEEDLRSGIVQLVDMVDSCRQGGLANLLLNSNIRYFARVRSVSALKARDEACQK